MDDGACMTNSKYSNQVDDIFEDLMAGHNFEYAAKKVKDLIESVRSDSLDAAVAVLPEKIDYRGNGSDWNDAIDLAKSNLLKLKKG
jgi:hypothetical protein